MKKCLIKKAFYRLWFLIFWKTKLKNYNNIEKKNVKKILIPPFFTPPHPFCYSFLNVISESPSLPFHVICQAGFRRYGLQIELKHSLHSTGYMCNTWFYNLIRLPFIYRVNNFIFRINMWGRPYRNCGQVVLLTVLLWSQTSLAKISWCSIFWWLHKI